MEETKYQKFIKESEKTEIFEWGSLFGAGIIIVLTLLCGMIFWISCTKDDNPRSPINNALEEIQ